MNPDTTLDDFGGKPNSLGRSWNGVSSRARDDFHSDGREKILLTAKSIDDCGGGGSKTAPLRKALEPAIENGGVAIADQKRRKR